MGEPKQIRACQDVAYTVWKTVLNENYGDVYKFQSIDTEEICAESREGARDPKADAEARLKALIDGTCKEKQCTAYRTVSEVQTEKVKPAWYTKLFAWISGEGR